MSLITSPKEKVKAYDGKIMSLNPSLYWPMRETDGEVFKDLIHGASMTFNSQGGLGGFNFVSGIGDGRGAIESYSVGADGKGGKFDVNVDEANQATFTETCYTGMSIWLRFDFDNMGLSDHQYVTNFYDHLEQSYILLRWYKTDNSWKVLAGISDSWSMVVDGGFTGPDNFYWHNFYIGVDGVNNLMTVAVDGLVVHASPGHPAVPFNCPTSKVSQENWALGGGGVAVGERSPHMIFAKYAIWDRILSEREIRMVGTVGGRPLVER